MGEAWMIRHQILCTVDWFFSIFLIPVGCEGLKTTDSARTASVLSSKYLFASLRQKLIWIKFENSCRFALYYIHDSVYLTIKLPLTFCPGKWSLAARQPSPFSCRPLEVTLHQKSLPSACIPDLKLGLTPHSHPTPHSLRVTDETTN